MDVYFSADVETDGPIPGRYSMLAVGVVLAGTFDGRVFRRPAREESLYLELRPISEDFQEEALQINGLDRRRLLAEGLGPDEAMHTLSGWIQSHAVGGEAVLVAAQLRLDVAVLVLHGVYRGVAFQSFTVLRHQDGIRGEGRGADCGCRSGQARTGAPSRRGAYAPRPRRRSRAGRDLRARVRVGRGEGEGTAWRGASLKR